MSFNYSDSMNLNSELKDIKVGERKSAKIVKINEGKAEDFRSGQYWEKVAEKNDKAEVERQKKQKCVEVITDNDASMVFALPEGNLVNPKSNLALFKKTYGKYPELNMEVQTKVDENGFNRLVLEK